MKEQFSALNDFFFRNGKVIFIGVMLCIGALVSWRYLSSYQDSVACETSVAYQHVISALDASKPATLEEVARFASKNSNIYGALASLYLAKSYVDTNQLDQASTQLQKGLKDTKDANLQAVMNLRLARIQLQQKQPNNVLKILDNVKGDGWFAIVADVRGEALLIKDDIKGARDVWSKGIDSNTSSILKEMLQMKVNNLSG